MNTDPSRNGEFGQRPVPPSLMVPKTASEALRPQIGTPPPRRSRASRNQFVVFLNFLMSLIVFAVIAGGAAIWFGFRAFDAPGPSETTGTILIQPNTGVQEIGQLLARRGFISDPRIFSIGLKIHGNERQMKAGEYEIKAHSSMRDIMELLKSGKSVLYSLTIPEGLTVEQAWQRIAEHEALTGEMPGEMPSEGMLVADTQRFTRGTDRAQIVSKMMAAQKRLIEDVWARRAQDLPFASIDEFVTLASIVEKETGRGDERSRVAGVFVNRLKKGMRLQSDPTIIYGLFGGKGKPADRPIYQSDIEKPTPYNTYVIDGLPPTPIANPGKAALEAAANPSQTNDFYFVADGSGGHAFAETLEEHNKNVARWRDIEKKKAEEAAKAGAGGSSQ
ncbi:MAG: endolytic transglycosylase MltG [Rhizobiaceae bacterium]